MSKVAIIGNGNVGYHFFNRISKKHEATLFSRNVVSEEVKPVEDFDPGDYDYTLLCLPDDLIKDYSDSLKKSDCTILHTSGSRPISDLDRHESRGVVYPLQTFTREKSIDFTAFPILIEGTETSEKSIFSFIRSFSTDVRLMNSENRAKLHLAAVFACNFTNHMYHISEAILSPIGASLKDLEHLASETLENAIEFSPKKSQTGPAKRADEETMAQHLRMIENRDWQEIYELISQDIRKSQG
ncbi:MAG: DUF2520 domain-containing protein [Cyclobacteriaceae bacterium]